jgi:hypothetical protein
VLLPRASASVWDHRRGFSRSSTHSDFMNMNGRWRLAGEKRAPDEDGSLVPYQQHRSLTVIRELDLRILDTGTGDFIRQAVYFCFELRSYGLIRYSVY